ncbi:uncharacterized protein LOC128386914 [Panonychus citri]|uniref:uncharacterized protein LOC128386914 n=1 Tax=Panonychus citri TaxID=50023 RepID=UPI002306FE3D|nr:uncharacterized protein LOC128386914 [Panonychus citri]
MMRSYLNSGQKVEAKCPLDPTAIVPKAEITIKRLTDHEMNEFTQPKIRIISIELLEMDLGEYDEMKSSFNVHGDNLETLDSQLSQSKLRKSKRKHYPFSPAIKLIKYSSLSKRTNG